MKKIKVRFNLGRGVNYMKYKIEYPDKSVVYVEPTNAQLIMRNCTLKSNKKTAEKIFNGDTKSVCGWVLCDDIFIKEINFLLNEGYSKVSYNPKVAPNWVYENINVDNTDFKCIINIDYSLYCMIK